MLPEVPDWAAFDELDLASPAFVAAAGELGRRFGLGDEWARFPTGSYPVLSRGSHVVKLTPPLAHDQHVAERQALLALEDARSLVTAPRLLAHGELDGWNFLVTTRVDGDAVRDCWSTFEPHARRRIARDVGTVLAQLHAVPWQEHFALSGDDGLTRHRREARTRHQRRGVDEAALEEIDRFAENARFRDPPVFLHADLHGAHILLRDPSLPAVLDFGDAFAGPAAYDFVTPTCFYFGGHEDLLGAMFDAYARHRPVPSLAELRAATMLHLFNDVNATLARLELPALADVDTSLRRIWCA